jgi:hypothetical protein
VKTATLRDGVSERYWISDCQRGRDINIQRTSGHSILQSHQLSTPTSLKMPAIDFNLTNWSALKRSIRHHRHVLGSRHQGQAAAEAVTSHATTSRIDGSHRRIPDPDEEPIVVSSSESDSDGRCNLPRKSYECIPAEMASTVSSGSDERVEGKKGEQMLKRHAARKVVGRGLSPAHKRQRVTSTLSHATPDVGEKAPSVPHFLVRGSDANRLPSSSLFRITGTP